MTAKAMSLEELNETLCKMANEQMVSDAYNRLYAVPLNVEAGRLYILQRAHFVLNRRSCWAHVQGNAPFDVKGLIWEHEHDELVGDAERGIADHYTLGVQEGAAVGLKPEDFEKTPPIAGVETCCYAWLHIACNKPWLEALASSSILEIANSDAIVKAGGNARRIGEKMRDELGIPFKKQASNAEHIVAEIEHANLLMKAASRYGRTAESQELILNGARTSLAIDRVYKETLAVAMEAIADRAAA